MENLLKIVILTGGSLRGLVRVGLFLHCYTCEAAKGGILHLLFYAAPHPLLIHLYHGI